jgi:hypothetical protein
MILIWIRTRIRNNRITDPDPGGQLITDPDLSWTFLWSLTKICCHSLKLVINVNKYCETVMILIQIRTRIRNNRIKDPGPGTGGQLITDPPDPQHRH